MTNRELADIFQRIGVECPEQRTEREEIHANSSDTANH